MKLQALQFASLQFALFFSAVFFVYRHLNHKWQNWLLLAASCAFYASWNWRFLFLVAISISTDYFCSIKIDGSRDERIRRCFLIASILTNLSILGAFKYFNFFAENIANFLHLFGLFVHPVVLRIGLPLGISFYTFRTMSYTIDVYTGKVRPTRNYLDYALFVIFFPLLAAGPIMRAGDLLPQITFPRVLIFNKIYEGCHLILWGLFQKIVVADNLAFIADRLFNSKLPYNGAAVLLALYAFAFQIYCDFAGYSNIARGLGKCLGFDIVVNFKLPYFASNPQDFWQRWHISLSSWLRDYLYYPMAFITRNWGYWGTIAALMITFTLCGLWHGAAWRFVVWGVYWGLLLVVYRSIQPMFSRKRRSDVAGRIWIFIRSLLFFHLVCLGWLIFRAKNEEQFFNLLYCLFFNFSLSEKVAGVGMILVLFPLLCIEALQHIKKDDLIVLKFNVILRTVFYLVISYLIFMFGVNGGTNFIYVNF